MHSPVIVARPASAPVPFGAPAAGPSRSEKSTRKILIGFISFLIATQLALVFIDQLSLFIPTGGLRVVLRSATYGASLLLLLALRRGGLRHPATAPALIVLAIIAVSILHPTTNTFLSGTAHAAIYFAILAPLFWVPRLRVDIQMFRRVVLILWGFHAVSAALGVVQVFFPGFFQPSLSSVVASYGEAYLESLRITLASGARVFRPMGLSDIPGGAAISGFYSVIFGIGFLLTSRRRGLRLICLASMGLGMMVLYLSQMRSMLVMTILCIVVFSVILGIRGQLRKVTLLISVVLAVIVGSFVAAVAVGGESVTSRLATFVEDRPANVYQANRGRFLDYTIDELLPQYPFGAGLGRWGMMNTYFGDNSDPERGHIWVEIQWTGWLLDGGIPLILAYVTALFVSIVTAWRLARRPGSARSDDLVVWGALLLAYNVGALAATFNGAFFIGQSGMEYWLLNAALFTAAHSRRPAALKVAVSQT